MALSTGKHIYIYIIFFFHHSQMEYMMSSSVKKKPPLVMKKSRQSWCKWVRDMMLIVRKQLPHHPTVEFIHLSNAPPLSVFHFGVKIKILRKHHTPLPAQKFHRPSIYSFFLFFSLSFLFFEAQTTSLIVIEKKQMVQIWVF